MNACWDRQNKAQEEEPRPLESSVCRLHDDDAVTTGHQGHDHAATVPISVSHPVSVSTSEDDLLKLIRLHHDTQIWPRLDK